MPRRGLNPRQKAFAHHYAVIGNATGAAKRAGYSQKTAYQQGHELLKHLEVKKLIDAIQAERNRRLEVSGDRILKELSRIAHADLGDAFGEDGVMLPINEMPEDVRRAAVGVDVEEHFRWTGAEREHSHDVLKLKLADKIRALELLGKYSGLWKDKLELTGKDGGPLAIASVEGLTDEQKRKLLGALETAAPADDGGSAEPPADAAEE